MPAASASVVIGIELQESETSLHVLYTGSKFRLSMPYFSVGIIPSKHSIAHPLLGLGGFQGRVTIVLSMHTPTEYQCLGTVQAQKAICTCVTLWGIDVMTPFVE